MLTTFIHTSVAGAQDLLARCSTALKWAGMDYHADKSRTTLTSKKFGPINFGH